MSSKETTHPHLSRINTIRLSQGELHAILQSRAVLSFLDARTIDGVIYETFQEVAITLLGIDLARPVFSHGQFYTALSCVRHRSHARIRLRPGETTTTNVTYDTMNSSFSICNKYLITYN